MTRPVPVGGLRPSQLLHTFGVGAVIDLPELSAIVSGIDDWPVAHAEPITEERLLAAVRQRLGPQVAALRSPPYTPESLNPFEFGATIGVPVIPFPRWLRCPRCRLLAPIENGLFQLREDRYRPDRVRYIHDCTTRGRPPTALAAPLPARVPQRPPRRLPLDRVRASRHALRPPDAAAHRAGGGRPGGGDRGPVHELQRQSPHVGRLRARGGGRATALPRPAPAPRHGERGMRPGAAHNPARRLELVVSRVARRALGAQPRRRTGPTRGGPLGGAAGDRRAGGARLRAQARPRARRAARIPGGRRLGSDRGPSRRRQRGERRPAGAGMGSPEQAAGGAEERGLPAASGRCRAASARRSPRSCWPSGCARWSRSSASRASRRRATPSLRRRRRPAPISRTQPHWVPCAEVRGEGLFLRLPEDRRRGMGDGLRTAGRVRVLRDAHVAWRRRRDLTPPTAGRARATSCSIRSPTRSCASWRSNAATEPRRCASASTRPGPEAHRWPASCSTPPRPTARARSVGWSGLGEPDQLGRLLHQAIEHARLCSSDPLCSEHEPVSDGSLHGAACHACQFAAETSCERGNRYLDRAALVGTFALDGLGVLRTMTGDPLSAAVAHAVLVLPPGQVTVLADAIAGCEDADHATGRNVRGAVADGALRRGSGARPGCVAGLRRAGHCRRPCPAGRVGGHRA